MQAREDQNTVDERRTRFARRKHCKDESIQNAELQGEPAAGSMLKDSRRQTRLKREQTER